MRDYNKCLIRSVKDCFRENFPKFVGLNDYILKNGVEYTKYG